MNYKSCGLILCNLFLFRKQHYRRHSPNNPTLEGNNDTADQNLHNQPHESRGAVIYQNDCPVRSPDRIQDNTDITPDADQEYEQIADLVSQHAPVTGVDGHYDEIDHSDVRSVSRVYHDITRYEGLNDVSRIPEPDSHYTGVTGTNPYEDIDDVQTNTTSEPSRPDISGGYITVI